MGGGTAGSEHDGGYEGEANKHSVRVAKNKVDWQISPRRPQPLRFDDDKGKVMAAIKNIFFYALLWLRLPFLLVGRLLTWLIFVVCIILYLAKAEESSSFMIYIWGAMGFLVFMACQLYDRVLLWAQPESLSLTLYQ